MKAWITEKKVNGDKREVVLMQSKRFIFPNAQLASFPVGTGDVSFTTSARDLVS